RVRLVDVLLAHLRRDQVAGVLRVIQTRKLVLGFGDAAERAELDEQRGGEEGQDRGEGRDQPEGRRAAESSHGALLERIPCHRLGPGAIVPRLEALARSAHPASPGANIAVPEAWASPRRRPHPPTAR